MLLDTEFRKAQKDSRELVVVVHGLSRTMLDHVPRCVAENMPTADVLIPKYSSGWLSNVDAVQLADELSGTIQSHYDRRERETGKPYERVILIGHSRGALFIRKAYVFASGQNHELWQGPLRPTPKAWARAVTRVVLLAGMHRGWSLSPKPPKMSWRRCLWLRSCDLMATLCRTARLMRAIKRGAPFVANLRVQWINLVRADHPMPVTVQILGNMDDLVSSSDNIDLQSGYNFIYMNAPPGTTHGGVADLSDPDRERVFLNALLTPDELLKSEYAVPETQKPEPSVEQVVFIMHGIRDFGGWTQRLASTITRQSQDQGRRVVTVTSSYGYFPMIKFLIFSERQQNVRWFMDQFTEALAKYPKARPIDFAGHSNGTYLLASALKRYRACAFGRAVFAGTVVPRGFEWNEMVDQGRVQAIRNYVATGDWVVGIFPRLFERMGDIGGAGLLGFEREPAANLEFHYVKGGHGAGIATKNFESITAFLLDGGSRPPPPAITRSEQNRLVILLSKLYWLVWLILIGVIISAAWWVAFAWSPAFVPSPWLRVAIFILLLLAVLNSI